MSPSPVAFDEQVDMIVVGYGFAGGAAAIAGADAGCRVLLLERTSVPRGISICSGGSLRIARDPVKALAYVTATNYGTIEPHSLNALRCPADSLFIRTSKGEFDAVLTMHHDQGRIAMKTTDFGHLVSAPIGIPVP